MNKLLKKGICADVCVIGGGLAGICAAIASARTGAKTVLMQDRPVLGGNASSEIRMWVSGAGSRVRHLQETGIVEEILLENMYRNPERNFSTWDSILYEKVKFEPNITLLLNCACMDAVCEANRIVSVTGFQLTTYTMQTVKATIFIDCSGDSILADLTDAAYMQGREAKETFNEDMGLAQADRKTMGMSLMIQAHETDHPVPFVPPSWAYTYETDEQMHNKPHDLYKINTNFYWIELGGEQDGIHDTEDIRDELLKIAFGAWDHIKNHGEHGAKNWELDWVGFLPGKRESRRYRGDYVMTQRDVMQAIRPQDTVAYGGWQIDNHLPGGFYMSGQGENHLQKVRLREPYGIPLRSLYSINIDNLMFAGRNISASHIAFATTRVMATCGVIGQAAGTAAAMAVQKGVSPRILGEKHIAEVQEQLLEDDCFLPGFRRQMPDLTKAAVLSAEYGDPFALQNGLDRKIWGNDNGYCGLCDRAITYTFPTPVYVHAFRLIVDSDLDREYVEGNPDGLNISTVLFKPLSYNKTTFGFPKCMLKSFDIEIDSGNGEWQNIYHIEDNHQRMIKGQICATCKAIRLLPRSTYYSETLWNTYGSAEAHLFAFDIR